MKVTFGYQYADFDPDKVIRTGYVNENKAVELFENFPWEEQFEIISSREDLNLTSTQPTVYFFISDDIFLSISSSSSKGFYIYYRERNQFGEVYVSNDVLNKPIDISVNQLINYFYAGSINKFLELYDLEESPREALTFNLNYPKYKLFIPLALPIGFFIFSYFIANDFIPSLIVGILVLLFISPRLYLNITYWNNDFNQKIIIEPSAFKVEKTNTSYTILKQEIKSCEYIHTPISQRAFDEFAHLKIRTENHVTIVTHMTVDPSHLLNLLKINYTDSEVYYPSLFKPSKKQLDAAKEDYRIRKIEFIKKYTTFETEKLEEIISKNHHYTDFAIDAAKEVLSERKISKN